MESIPGNWDTGEGSPVAATPSLVDNLKGNLKKFLYKNRLTKKVKNLKKKNQKLII